MTKTRFITIIYDFGNSCVGVKNYFKHLLNVEDILGRPDHMDRWADMALLLLLRCLLYRCTMVIGYVNIGISQKIILIKAFIGTGSYFYVVRR